MKLADNLIKKVNEFVTDGESSGRFKTEAELDAFITNYVDKKLRDIWVQRLILLLPWLIHLGVLAMFLGLSQIWVGGRDNTGFSISKFFYWFFISLAISALLRLLTVTVNMFSRVKYNDRKMRRIAPRILESYFMMKDSSLKSVKVKLGKFRPLFRFGIKKIEIETEHQIFSFDLWEKKKFSFILFFLGFFVSIVKTLLKYIRVFSGTFMKNKYVVSREVKLSFVPETTKEKFKEHNRELMAAGFSLKNDVVTIKRKKVTWSQKGLQVTDILIHSRHKEEMKPEIYKIMDEKLKFYKQTIVEINNLTY